MKKLPIGIQDFGDLRSSGYLYVDKTEYIHKLLDGKYYFLSRPRRFGKSLLVSTLKYMFQGRKDLFKGLWIEDKIGWDVYPVIHIDFTRAGHQSIGLKKALENQMLSNAEEHLIELEGDSPVSMFEELIKKLSANDTQPTGSPRACASRIKVNVSVNAAEAAAPEISTNRPATWSSVHGVGTTAGRSFCLEDKAMEELRKSCPASEPDTDERDRNRQQL